MPTTKDREKRQSIIDACRSMNALGINQGTSGNISLRHGEGLLITPTSTPYEAMQPEQIVFMGNSADVFLARGPLKLKAQISPAAHWPPATELWVKIPPESVRLLPRESSAAEPSPH